MPMTLSDGTTTIDLPPDLQWTDEFDWSDVEQTKEYSLTGALIVQQGVKAKGRPFTLQSNGASWVKRSVVELLQTFYNTPDTVFTLSIDGTDYLFQFERPGGFRAAEAQRLMRSVQGPDYPFTIEIKGFEVAA